MKITICAIIKDELDYLEEWIQHNLGLGFDDIHLYEDTGSKSHKLITDKYSQVILHNISEVTERPHYLILMNLFEYFARHYKTDYDWCAYIDPDEYIELDKNFSLKDLVKYDLYPGVLIQQKTYGANGHIYKPLCDGVVDNYKTLTYYSYLHKYIRFKTIANLKFDIIFNTRSGIHVANGSVFTDTLCSSIPNIPSYINIWYDHYYTKSWEEWVDRFISRGDVFPGNTKVSDFFSYNKDMMNIFLSDFMKTDKGKRLLSYLNTILENFNKSNLNRVLDFEFYKNKTFLKFGRNSKVGHNIKAINGACLVSIGNNVSIGDNLNLIDDLPIKIGNNVVIGDNVAIYGGSVINDNSRIKSNSIIKL